MFWIELIIVLAIIFIGVRVGGTFLAMAGGIGMFIMTFILHVTPSDPPITVILIMIAVICAAATMQACGGLDYLVRIAEKILRKNPKMITVLAPVVAYIFTFMCGTGHIVYSLLPVINEIAIETGVRPERPISASIVSSQQAITACPISAATVGILAFMAEATNYTKVNIFTLLIVCVPATLIGTVIAAIAVIKKGKELADDPEFQARVEAGLIEDFSKKVKEEKKVSKEAKISVTIFLIAMVGIVLLGAVSGLVPTLADGSKLPLTTVIEIFMLVAAAPMNYHYLRYPIKKFLDKVERSPFNSIDLYCSAPQLNLFDYPLSRLIELKKEIEAHHLSVMAMTPENCVYPVNFCTQDDLTRESSIRYYQRAIDTAQFLDCPCVQISTGFGYFDQPREEGWKYCRESLWTLAQYCEKKDVRLLLEELKVTTTNVLITSKDIAKMLEEIDSPAIVGMVDMDQMTYAKETIDDYFDNLGDKLQHIHFNDRGHTVPGDGDFPMKEYYDSIKNRGYDGTVSFEICDRRYYRDPDKAIDDIVAWMKANTNEFD